MKMQLGSKYIKSINFEDFFLLTQITLKMGKRNNVNKKCINDTNNRSFIPGLNINVRMHNIECNVSRQQFN